MLLIRGAGPCQRLISRKPCWSAPARGSVSAHPPSAAAGEAAEHPGDSGIRLDIDSAATRSAVNEMSGDKRKIRTGRPRSPVNGINESGTSPRTRAPVP